MRVCVCIHISKIMCTPTKVGIHMYATYTNCQTLKMVKKVIMNLDSSKVSGPNCIPVVTLKNCEPELSCILAELFDMCLKESCFPDCQQVSLLVPVFKNDGKRSIAKNYHPVSPFSVVSKVFEKLVNKRIVDQLEKCGLFSDFQNGFRSSQS